MAIAIAGAGIGGLTTALALGRRGFEVALYEKAWQLEEAGAGIQLTPNALNVLASLGLGSALDKTMVRLEAVLVRQGVSGRLIQRLPLDLCERRWGSPYGVIHRADLQAVLLDAVRANAIPLALGHEVGAIRQDDQGASLSFASGQADIRARLIVGADGLWSNVRKSLSAAPPRFAGRRAWRAVIPAAAAPDFMQGRITGLWLGERAHLVHYPVRGATAFNLVAVTHDRDSRPGWSTPQAADALLPHYQGWDKRVLALLDSVLDWRTWPLFEGAPASGMAKGRIALIGDAAHPMLPFLAQGGACAIEDGAELAAHLTREPADDTARLRAWALRREPRVARIQAEARANGERYHWRWPLSTARDLGLTALGGRRMLERYDWLYGWKPAETA